MVRVGGSSLGNGSLKAARKSALDTPHFKDFVKFDNRVIEHEFVNIRPGQTSDCLLFEDSRLRFKLLPVILHGFTVEITQYQEQEAFGSIVYKVSGTMTKSLLLGKDKIVIRFGPIPQFFVPGSRALPDVTIKLPQADFYVHAELFRKNDLSLYQEVLNSLDTETPFTITLHEDFYLFKSYLYFLYTSKLPEGCSEAHVTDLYDFATSKYLHELENMCEQWLNNEHLEE